MDKRILWCDLETTGLDPNTDRILSVGLVVTDAALNVVAEFEHDVRSPSERKWEWPPVVREMHTKSGLATRILSAPFTLDEIEVLARAFVHTHAGEKPYLAGSTVHFDARFLGVHMPKVLALCHYRMLDVSVFKVLGSLWGIKAWENPLQGKAQHTPLADIRDSIASLRYYVENVLFDEGAVIDRLFFGAGESTGGAVAAPTEGPISGY
jgi:oligoribonuclease